MKVLIYALLLALAATPASADPITSAIVGLLGVGTASAAAAIVGFVVNTVVSALLSSLLTALQGKPKPSGIKNEYTKDGGVNPFSFIIGKYATAGTMVCPPMSHDINGRVRGMANYVINIADMPGHALNRLIINGEYVAYTPTEVDSYGNGVLGKYFSGGKYSAYVRYYNGNQTVADPLLLSKYGTASLRPWASSMVGFDTCYAIMSFRFNKKLFSGAPSVRFEILGIPLYDPRKDSTVGGSGAHRWGNKATYERTVNPIVMVYNILRGIPVVTGKIYGGRASLSDLPFSNWVAAMNKCDILVLNGDGVYEPQYMAGYEIQVSEDEPADVIEELLKSCSGEIAETGGVYRVRVGGADLPVFFFTDEDLLITQPKDYKPFPGLNAAHNFISATYPDPESLWERHDAPSLQDDTLVSRDQGRVLSASVSLPAVPFPYVVQRLMSAWLKDDQRWRRHTLPFGPCASMLEPLDTISWTSSKNGYTNKLFEVGQVEVNSATLNAVVSVRERDPADYTPLTQIAHAPSPTGWTLPAPQDLPGWGMSGVSITDNASAVRRPALRLYWTPLVGANANQPIAYEIRLATTQVVVSSGVTTIVDTGELTVSEGILPNMAYEARGMVNNALGASWTSWYSAVTPDVGLTNADFGTAGGYSALFTSQGLYAIRDVTILPSSSAFVGEKVFNRTDGKLYQWTGSSWQAVVADPANGSISAASFAAGIAPVEIFATLPTTGNYAGRMVFLTTDNKLYRHTGTPAGSGGFTIAVDGSDILANSIVAGKIAAGAIGAREIAAGEVLASKVVVSDFANLYPDYDFADAAFYSSPNSASYVFPVTSFALLGRRYMVIDPNAASRSVNTNWFPIEISTEYLVSAAAWLETNTVGSGTSTVTFETGSIDASGVVTVLNSTVVQSRTDSTTISPASVTIVSGATARRGRFVVTRAAGGTSISDAGAFKVQKKGTGSLTVDGTITGNKMVANTITGGLLAASGIITSTAQIGDGLITNAKISGVIQSDNFVTGVSGWSISKAGSAEFNSLVVRQDMIVKGAVTRNYIGRKTGSSVNVTATTAATAPIVIDEFNVNFAANDAGLNPVIFSIFGRGASLVSGSSMQFLIEGYLAGVWEQIDISLPYHCAETSYSTRTHHFNYGFYTENSNLALYSKMRVKCWMSTVSPYSSHGFRIDYLTMTAVQGNR